MVSLPSPFITWIMENDDRCAKIRVFLPMKVTVSSACAILLHAYSCKQEQFAFGYFYIICQNYMDYAVLFFSYLTVLYLSLHNIHTKCHSALYLNHLLSFCVCLPTHYLCYSAGYAIVMVRTQ